MYVDSCLHCLVYVRVCFSLSYILFEAGFYLREACVVFIVYGRQPVVILLRQSFHVVLDLLEHLFFFEVCRGTRRIKGEKEPTTCGAEETICSCSTVSKSKAMLKGFSHAVDLISVS